MLKLNSNRFIAAVVTAAVAFSLIIASPWVGEGWFGYADAESEGFVIKDYQVNVDVTEDRVYKITETITCDFSEQKHGIFRCIPTIFRVERADGSKAKMVATIENFNADTDWEYDDEYEFEGSASAYYTVRLGSAYNTVIGEQKYTISYDYVCSPDTLKDADEFYFNIIGSGWKTDIEHASFTVNMPKNFDVQTVGYSMGFAGSAGVPEGELVNAVSERTISGETLRPLSEGEALTVRVELPDGYFTNSDNGLGNLWRYLVTIILALVSIVMCWKLGRDDKIIPVVSFEAPEGYNSMDVGVMDHLDATDDDALSLLVYLADKGYLKIEPLPDWRGKLEHSKNFKFHKVKEYDGNNPCEKEFLDGMFGAGDTVKSVDLEDKFYETIETVRQMEAGLTAKLVSRKGRGPITLMIIASILLIWLPSRQYGGLFNYISTMYGVSLIGFLVGLACIVVMMICWKFIEKRTPLGIELAGQARGLKEFIETAEKDRIEQLIEDDPQSFYKIIPYAMVLGVSDKWIKKFKDITLERPDWYMYDSPVMEGYMIGHILSSTLNNTMSRVAEAPSSSGGGGFSGGGAGGGGGGSW